ncbi:MAG: right-handed parallel beta-helix repeat-containing protein, partial [Planctomycetota bacterium]
ATRSRLPENGYFLHETPFDVRWKSTFEGGWERPPTDDELLTLRYRPEDLGDWFEPRNAELTIFHMWDESLVGVADFDPGEKTMRFSNHPGYPPGAFSGQYDMERRYVVWNLAEGLRRPGQWMLDRVAGEVVYWPREGEDMATAFVVAPRCENVIRIDGAAEDPVEGIELRGFSIAATNAPLMAGAFGAKLFDGAISLRHAHDCRLSDLEVYGVGAHAIKAIGDRLKVQGCRIHHTGASALRHLGSGSTITDNEIHHVGQSFPSAIALYVGATDPNDNPEWDDWKHTHDVTIAHNEIHDTPYTAIAAGGKDHRIESNLIYRAMQDLYDGAGIYITFCEGIALRGNFVRDIKESAGAGTSAYYLDELSKQCVVEGNLSIDVARPMHNHISSGNRIEGNVFITPDDGRLTLERSDNYVFVRNVVMSKGDFRLYDLRACSRFEGNVFSAAGELLTHELDHYEIASTSPLPLGESNSASAEDIQIDPTGRVEVATDSPAHKLGIKPLDVSPAGVRDPKDRT